MTVVCDFAKVGYAPGTIAVNVTWIKREFSACQTHCSMYPSIFNRFPISKFTVDFFYVKFRRWKLDRKSDCEPWKAGLAVSCWL